MTNKDYQTLAGLIAYTQNAFLKGRINAEDILPQLVRFIVEDAKTERPRFDEVKFRDAAGTGYGTIYMGV